MGEEPREPLPPEEPGFAEITLMFRTSALVHLGEAPDPVSGKKQQDLGRAKRAIDLLGILQEKTRGNLTPEEGELLDALLYDLRMRYLQAVGAAKP